MPRRRVDLVKWPRRRGNATEDANRLRGMLRGLVDDCEAFQGHARSGRAKRGRKRGPSCEGQSEIEGDEIFFRKRREKILACTFGVRTNLVTTRQYLLNVRAVPCRPEWGRVVVIVFCGWPSRVTTSDRVTRNCDIGRHCSGLPSSLPRSRSTVENCPSQTSIAMAVRRVEQCKRRAEHY